MGATRPTGHGFRVERRGGPVWYAKYRLPDGRQVQKKLGPAWTDRGRPAAGYFTKRTAEDWLGSVLEQARRGTLPGMLRTGATFADAAAEWLRYVEHDRGPKPSTVKGYQSIVGSELLPRFGERPLERITTDEIQEWLDGMAQSAGTRTKALVMMHGIFKRARRVWSLPSNPAADVEKPTLSRSGDLQVYSPEEVWALVRAAESESDAALFLTAAFTGLRMGELLALRWRDVDFAGSSIRVRASYYAGNLSTPKSGTVRAVPLAPDVAAALAQLGRRDWFVGDDDLVFAGDTGSYLDGSALRRRYKAALAAAGLRPLRFHDLRHTFGTRMIAKADIRRVHVRGCPSRMSADVPKCPRRDSRAVGARVDVHRAGCEVIASVSARDLPRLALRHSESPPRPDVRGVQILAWTAKNAPPRVSPAAGPPPTSSSVPERRSAAVLGAGHVGTSWTSARCASSVWLLSVGTDRGRRDPSVTVAGIGAGLRISSFYGSTSRCFDDQAPPRFRAPW